MGGEVDAETDRSWNARLSRDKAAPLKHLHHLVDARRRDKKSSLNVRFGRCSAKALHVLEDEREVFELALRGRL